MLKVRVFILNVPAEPGFSSNSTVGLCPQIANVVGCNTNEIEVIVGGPLCALTQFACLEDRYGNGLVIHYVGPKEHEKPILSIIVKFLRFNGFTRTIGIGIL